MKGLVIAAGRGGRLGSFTEFTPKPLVKVNDSCFFENTIKHFHSLGITDIAAVVGYRKEQFKAIKGVTFFENNNWENNNILHSMFSAKNFMDDDIIIAYGDIWFEEEPIKNMCMNDKDFAIAVDQDWEEYYHGRTEHPISEAENVYYDNNLLVKDIGKHIHDPKDNAYNTGEFMGLVKISKKIIKNVVNEFNNLELNIKKTDNFQKSVEFQNAYLTDFIQYLIGREYDISCCINKQGWYEVDTTQDLENLKFNLGF